MPSERAQTNQELRSALRKEERANAALAVTIRSVAHELRTPLTAILGFTEMIINKSFGPIDPPRYADYIEHINFSANHLLFITETLLDIAQIEAGAQGLDEQVVGLDDLLESAIRLVTPQFQQKGVVLDRFRQIAPQRAIASDAAGSRDAPNAKRTPGADRLCHEHVHDCRLDAGG